MGKKATPAVIGDHYRNIFNPNNESGWIVFNDLLKELRYKKPVWNKDARVQDRNVSKHDVLNFIEKRLANQPREEAKD